MPRTRDFMLPGRSAAISDRGMASTSHVAATLAAVEILRSGGNAVDAALAAVALQGVVEPHMTGIGGDCFVVYKPAGGQSIALNGSGRAPAALALDHFRDRRIAAIDPRSAHAVTVPGAVGAWCTLADDHGTLPLERVLRPAIEAAEEGFLVTQRTAHDWALYADQLQGRARETFTPGGKSPTSGERFALPALARTLRRIARHGAAGFYEGPVAEEIVALLRHGGGLHTPEDFASASADYATPLAAGYREYTLHEVPPNGQGIAALMIARLLDRFDLSDPGYSMVDQIHLLAEATKAVYAQREALVADPAFSPIDYRDGLDPAFLDSLAAGIDLRRASTYAAFDFPQHRDTVQVSVVDRDGNAISLINSICSAFGSGLYAAGAGVLLQNRGAGFSLVPGHPNALAGGKRPFHTIIPGLLTLEDKAAMVFGVVGLQYQAVGQFQIISGVIDGDLDVQQACDAPRSFAFDGVLSLETTVPAEVAAELAERGHKLSWATQPLGGCQAVWIDQARGVMLGAADHRKDGIALGL